MADNITSMNPSPWLDERVKNAVQRLWGLGEEGEDDHELLEAIGQYHKAKAELKLLYAKGEIDRANSVKYEHSADKTRELTDLCYHLRAAEARVSSLTPQSTRGVTELLELMMEMEAETLVSDSSIFMADDIFRLARGALNGLHAANEQLRRDLMED